MITWNSGRLVVAKMRWSLRVEGIKRFQPAGCAYFLDFDELLARNKPREGDMLSKKPLISLKGTGVSLYFFHVVVIVCTEREKNTTEPSSRLFYLDLEAVFHTNDVTLQFYSLVSEGFQLWACSKRMSEDIDKLLDNNTSVLFKVNVYLP
jgi:hypothetical protein